MPPRWNWISIEVESEEEGWFNSLSPQSTDQEPWKDISEGRLWRYWAPGTSENAGDKPVASGRGPFAAKPVMLKYSTKMPSGHAKPGPKPKDWEACAELALNYLRQQSADRRDRIKACRGAMAELNPELRKRPFRDFKVPRSLYDLITGMARAQGLIPPR
jgi:hypothetical protein